MQRKVKYGQIYLFFYICRICNKIWIFSLFVTCVIKQINNKLWYTFNSHNIVFIETDDLFNSFRLKQERLLTFWLITPYTMIGHRSWANLLLFSRRFVRPTLPRYLYIVFGWLVGWLVALLKHDLDQQQVYNTSLSSICYTHTHTHAVQRDWWEQVD